MGLQDFNLSVRMKEAIYKIAVAAVKDVYTPPRYGTVTAVNYSTAKATVQYPDEAGTFTVAMTRFAPSVGSIVRIARPMGKRYVDDVITGLAIVNGDVGTVDVGEIKLIGYSTVPAKWLECVGGTVAVSSYPDYAAKVSTTWGGNGSTTVGLPDFRGRVPMGAGTGSGLTARTLGQNAIGEETHVLTASETAVKGHSHTHSGNTGSENATHYHASDSQTVANYDVASRQSVSGAGWWHGIGAWNTGTESAFHQHDMGHTHTLADGASGSAHNNIQPSAVAKFIIRVLI